MFYYKLFLTFYPCKIIIIIIFISLLLRFVSRWMQREEST